MQDAAKATTRKECMSRWEGCFREVGNASTSEPHTIVSQFHEITFNHGLYTFWLKAGGGRTAPNVDSALLAAGWLVARNFWPQQLLRLRRLTENGKLPGGRGVISLPSLLDDMDENLEALGLGTKEIDDRRKPIGRLKLKVMAAAEKITAIANKYVAHAATQWSIQLDSKSSETVNVEGLWSCTETLARVARTVECHLLGQKIPRFALQVSYLNPPPGSEAIENVRLHLEGQRRVVGSWGPWAVDENF